MDKLGIYVHIPFCKSKCKYCDFISFSCKESNIKEYFDVLIKEIQNTKYNKNKEVTTIYLGGGTPSVPDSKYIVNTLQTIKKVFRISSNAEITIEINPGTITKQKLVDYKNAGVNRISIGLQSTNDRILKLIGRIHNYEQFINTYNLVKEVGYNNINVDLMLGIPTQTEDELIDSVRKVIKLNPNHISIYSLIVEENTEIKKMIDNNKIKMISEETERNMYSYIDKKRFSNTENFNEYIQNKDNLDKNIIISEIQDRQDQCKEYMLIGLRKIDGVSISEFERKFRINPLFYFRFEISNLVQKELIEVDLDKIKLTKKGLDFANIVFEEFI